MLLEKYRDYLSFHNLKPKRVVNALQYLLWGKRSARLRHYPLFYMLETGNVCRLRCPFCVQGNYDSQVNSSKRLMGYDDFLVILRKIQDYALVLDLFKHGEPFLNPEIVRMTAAASAAGLRCRISSALNFTLTDEMAREICRSGLYKLTCAIDGVTQRAYEKYRVNGDLRLALDNAARIIRARNAARRRRPIIIFRMLVFEWNHEQVEAARQLAVEMGFDGFAADPGVFVAGD
jgi:MoaA/NifB/PqqE/SkfB family radical SAM enzyme